MEFEVGSEDVVHVEFTVDDRASAQLRRTEELYRAMVASVLRPPRRTGAFVVTSVAEAEGWREMLTRAHYRAEPDLWSLDVAVRPRLERDPVLERAPRTLREVLAWMLRCVSYSWRAATGELREEPAERWQFAGVTLFEARMSFPLAQAPEPLRREFRFAP